MGDETDCSAGLNTCNKTAAGEFLLRFSFSIISLLYQWDPTRGSIMKTCGINLIQGYIKKDTQAFA